MTGAETKVKVKVKVKVVTTANGISLFRVSLSEALSEIRSFEANIATATEFNGVGSIDAHALTGLTDALGQVASP